MDFEGLWYVNVGSFLNGEKDVLLVSDDNWSGYICHWG